MVPRSPPLKPMENNSAFCIATSRKQAGCMVDGLKASAFTPLEVSVLLPAIDRDLSAEGSDNEIGAVRLGATESGEASGPLGWVPGYHALDIPGAGLFIAAGWVGEALNHSAARAGLGAIAGALMELGFPETEAVRYEGKLKGGDIVLGARARNAAAQAGAQEIFLAAGARDVCASGPTFTSRLDSSPPAAVWPDSIDVYQKAGARTVSLPIETDQRGAAAAAFAPSVAVG